MVMDMQNNIQFLLVNHFIHFYAINEEVVAGKCRNDPNSQVALLSIDVKIYFISVIIYI